MKLLMMKMMNSQALKLKVSVEPKLQLKTSKKSMKWKPRKMKKNSLKSMLLKFRLQNQFKLKNLLQPKPLPVTVT
jgi:hypothetical protein